MTIIVRYALAAFVYILIGVATLIADILISERNPSAYEPSNYFISALIFIAWPLVWLVMLITFVLTPNLTTKQRRNHYERRIR